VPKAHSPLRKRAESPLLSRVLSLWLSDGEARGWTDRTLENRRRFVGYFVGYLEEAGVAPTLEALNDLQVREYLAAIRQRGQRPSTVATHHRHLRALANWLVEEGLLEDALRVKAPKIPFDQIQPFSPEQIQRLLDAVRRSRCPVRDVALVLTLLDTGLRVSEVVSLKVGDVDRAGGAIRVLGKGGKFRSVYVSKETRRALTLYLTRERGDARADDRLFVAATGIGYGEGLSVSGVFQLIQRAGVAAGLTGVRCSPHTLCHSFAVTFLRGGGNLFELQQLMGHTDLTILRRYVALAEADLEQAHRRASPVQSLKVR
jgi:site-specific recombinase XerD